MSNSGIYSLAGFAYQIKVLIYYLTQLQDNYALGFETYDDVALQRTDDSAVQEGKLQTYNGIFSLSSGITALQVKRKTLSNEDYEKVLFNWIILNNSSTNVEKFVLLVDKSYGNVDSVFSVDLRSLYNKIVTSSSNRNISYRISRVLATDKCYFSYKDEIEGEPIDLSEYKDRLQAVFAVDKVTLENLHKFTDERLTYRSFTLFNFLGEIRQGVLVDFFDKCSQIEYSTKISPILNFIFNKNVARIFWLKNEITRLQEEIKQKEQVDGSNKHLIHKVNLNLTKLNIKDEFNGCNGEAILSQLSNLANQIESSKPLATKSVSDLEIICSNIDEQIKVYEKYKSDLQHQQHENKNRENMLDTFQSIIKDHPDFNYLVEPLISLTDEIKNSISFSQYFLKDDVLEKLKKQRQNVKNEIVKAQMQLTRFSLDEKKKAIAIAEDGIKSYFTDYSPADLEKLKKDLRDYKKELKELQDSDDTRKINSISSQITNLYKSAYQTSDFVQEDFNETKDEFHIKYNKGRNALQTMTVDEKDNAKVYGTGSHARHTLIQLCGYLIFMKMLIEENKYPIIPMLVIDHISKPFSDQNVVCNDNATSSYYPRGYPYGNDSDGEFPSNKNRFDINLWNAYSPFDTCASAQMIIKKVINSDN